MSQLGGESWVICTHELGFWTNQTSRLTHGWGFQEEFASDFSCEIQLILLI
jgi:hypothetical protein